MKTEHKICFITNFGPHYRFPIFNLMGEELACDFFIGDKLQTSIKPFDYKRLNGYKKTLHNRFFRHFYWQSGSVGLLFKPYKYYLLDGEPYCLSSWAIVLLAKLLGKKTIAWTHGWYGRESRPKAILKKIFYSLHHKIFLYGEYALQLMKEQGFAPEKLFCIANSLDSDADKTIRETLVETPIYKEHFHNDWPTVIYCGRIQKGKKLEMLVDSLKLMNDDGFSANAVIVGKDVDGVGLHHLVSQQGLDCQVWFYGPCYDNKTLAQLFYNAAVCVSPGHVGLTAIHSLTFGCPVITHNNFPYHAPEFEAITPGLTGDFFEQDNIVDLKAKMQRWLSLSPEERTQVRSHAFAEVDRKWNIHHQINIIKKAIYE